MSKNVPIKILQCVSNMDRAGIETMLMNFYRKIDKKDIQFDFLVNKSKIGDYDEEIKSMGGKIYVTPGLSPFKWFKYQKFMNDFFHEHDEYKIIHCQNEAMGFPALLAAKKANVPIRIAHSHNTTTRLDIKWPIKITYKSLLKRYATNLVACSKAAGEYLFGKDVKIINNAIDSEKFVFDEVVRNEVRNKFKLKNKFVLGHVGRFEPQKNHKFLIDIFNDYVKVDSNSILLLIGEGTLQSDIKKRIDNYGLRDKVLLIGNVSNVNDYYQAMDLFLLPSFHEGLPVVGVEAQASGLRCLFSNKITREVNICDNCEFIDISSVEPWVKAIMKSKNYQRRKDMKDLLIKKNYDIYSATLALEKYYKELYELGAEK